MSNTNCCGQTGCTDTTQTSAQTQTEVKTSENVYRPRMDVLEFADRYEISVDLPGSASDAISATIDDGVLTVEAGVPDRYEGAGQPLAREFGVGDFRRRVRLGEDVDRDNVQGAYTNGVLTLTLPKRAEAGARSIPINGN